MVFSLVSLLFEGWSLTSHLNILLSFEENFLFLVCELFRAHEMCR